MRKTFGAIGLGTALVLLAGAACTSASASDGGQPAAAATVDGQAIEMATFERRLGTVTENADVKDAMQRQPNVRERLRADVLAQMIEAALIERGARTLDVTVTDEALQNYVEDITKNYLGGRPGAWQAFLKERGYPEKEVRQQLREDLRRERVEDALAGEPKVTDSEVSKVFRTEYAQRSRVRHILVPGKQQAEKLLGQIQDGADFGDLAERHSQDFASASQGGELGAYVRDQYVAPFEEAVEQADDGEVVGPVATPFGYHVIERMAPPTYPEISSKIRKDLREQAQDAAVTKWVTKLRQQSNVTVRKEFGNWDAKSGKIV